MGGVRYFAVVIDGFLPYAVMSHRDESYCGYARLPSIRQVLQRDECASTPRRQRTTSMAMYTNYLRKHSFLISPSDFPIQPMAGKSSPTNAIPAALASCE